MITAKQVLLFAKIQPTAGTYSDSVAADWMEVKDLTLTPLDASEVELPIISDKMGAKPKYLVGLKAKVSFSIAVAGSGVAGTKPAWGVLERICGKAEVISATDVKYNPVSAGFELGSLVVYIGNNQHAIRDARGTSRLEISRNGFLKRTYEITGIYIDPIELAPPTVSTLPRVVPLVLQPGNTTLSFHTLTNLCLHSLSLDDGNDIKFLDMLNCTAQVMIADRMASGSIEFLADSVATKNWFTAAKNGDVGAVSAEFGTVAGNIIQVDMPKVQLLKPDYGDVDGIRSIKLGLNILPNAGNDDYTITVK